MLYNSFSQRPPYFGVSTPPAFSELDSCKVLHKEILENCEDIRYFPGASSSWAVLSCDKGRRGWSPSFGMYDSNGPEGQLFLWNRDTPDVAPRELPFKGASGPHGETRGDFHPVGVAIAPVEGSKYRIFVANQARHLAHIEVLDFDLENFSYEHIQTVSNPRIHSPNSITALDKDHFFVATDFSFARRWSAGVALEALFGLPFGEALYVGLHTNEHGFRDARVQVVAKIAVASGIELDREKRQIYITSLTGGVYQYSYDIQPKQEGDESIDIMFPLKFKSEAYIRTPFWADNLMFTSDKRLFVSGILSAEGYFTSLLSSQAAKPESWVVELLPKIEKSDLNTAAGRNELNVRLSDPANSALRREEARWRSVFWDNGKFFGGLTTGQLLEDNRFIGVGLANNGVLVCNNIKPGRGWLSEKKKAAEEKAKQEL